MSEDLAAFMAGWEVPASHQPCIMIPCCLPDNSHLAVISSRDMFVEYFLRQNFDHRFVAVDDEIRQGMTSADLAFLDTAHYNELQKLYPRVDKGEGWYCAEVAYSHLPGKPLHE